MRAVKQQLSCCRGKIWDIIDHCATLSVIFYKINFFIESINKKAHTENLAQFCLSMAKKWTFEGGKYGK